MEKEEREKEIRRIVARYNIQLGPQPGTIKLERPDSEEEAQRIRAAKPEILAYLENQKRAEEEIQRKEEEEKREILESKKAIELVFHDGEYFQGWEVVGTARELLEKAGIAENLGGGISAIKTEYQDRLGQKFFWGDVEKIIQERDEKKREKEEAEKRLFEEKLAEAKRVGGKVILESRHEWLDDTRYLLSQVWICPDGKIQIIEYESQKEK